jgi:hypothetical protein
VVVHRKSSTSGQPKPAINKVIAPTTVALVAATVAASSSVRGTGWTVLLTADAWDSSRRVTKFLEGLKNKETDREGIPFPPLEASIH